MQLALDWLMPILTSAVIALLGFIAAQLTRAAKTLPTVFLAFAENYLAHARQTAGVGDDTVGMAMVIFARALIAAFGKRGGDQLDPPVLRAPAVTTTKVPVDDRGEATRIQKQIDDAVRYPGQRPPGAGGAPPK